MTDRPITFSAPMVQALLAGRKTQTRRIITLPTKSHTGGPIYERADMGGWEVTTHGGAGCFTFGSDGERIPVPESPGLWHRTTGTCVGARYAAGDRLYVREHWKTMALHDRVSPSDLGERYRASVYGNAAACPVICLADGHRQGGWALPSEEETVAGWRPGKHRQAMHMPRWASRLTLVVEDVRVERLRSISVEDVLAEGAPLDPNHRDTTLDGSNPFMCVGDHPWTSQSPHAWYHRLWDSLNGDGAWEANPFVAAYTFRVERGNIDQIARAA